MIFEGVIESKNSFKNLLTTKSVSILVFKRTFSKFECVLLLPKQIEKFENNLSRERKHL